ncbi:MAG: haloacid dehalogenase type II [Hyphomicrobiales bacterium]
MAGIKVIVFDTFGTVVDWRGSITRDLSDWGAAQGITADWGKLADLWRGQYEPEMDRVRRGEIPFTRLDELHAHALPGVLECCGIDSLSEEQFQFVNRVWHRLDPWPDSVPGLHRLKTKFVIGPLSNGNVALLVNMAKHAGLPWDHVFSCELFRAYKPHPDSYLGVARMMDVKPSEVMMCAAHNYDLAAARKAGLATAFVPRTTEFGPGQTTDLVPTEDWDVIADDFDELASRLGT